MILLSKSFSVKAGQSVSATVGGPPAGGTGRSDKPLPPPLASAALNCHFC